MRQGNPSPGILTAYFSAPSFPAAGPIDPTSALFCAKDLGGQDGGRAFSVRLVLTGPAGESAGVRAEGIHKLDEETLLTIPAGLTYLVHRIDFRSRSRAGSGWVDVRCSAGLVGLSFAVIP